MIELIDVSFRYNKNSEKVIDQMSFWIEAGEYVSIVGVNGSGKSTLAKLLNGLILPEEGRVFVDGLETQKDPWMIRKRVGLVFQNPDNQLIASSVEEEIAFGPENLSIPSAEIRTRLENVLQIVGLTEQRMAPPEALSGGQKQRLAIASILAMNPQYLVLDESTSMLDQRGRGEILDTIAMLNTKYGMTVLHITHDMEEAARAQRILVLHQGKLYLDGSPAEIFSKADELHKTGLALPQIVNFIQRLREQSVTLPQGLLSKEELVNELCRLHFKR